MLPWPTACYGMIVLKAETCGATLSISNVSVATCLPNSAPVFKNLMHRCRAYLDGQTSLNPGRPVVQDCDGPISTTRLAPGLRKTVTVLVASSKSINGSPGFQTIVAEGDPVDVDLRALCGSELKARQDPAKPQL